MLDNGALEGMFQQVVKLQPDPKIENLAFALDVHYCFGAHHAGALGSHIYSSPNPHIPNDMVNGDKLWLDIISRQSAYYIYGDEPAFIKEIAQDVCRIVGDYAHVYDLGPGSESAIIGKTLPFLSGFPNLSGYYPIDISSNFVRSAERVVKGLFPDTSVKGYSLNFQKDPLPVEHSENGVVLYLGSTISNLPGNLHSPFSKNKAAIREFSRLRSLIGDGGHLILLHDSNQNAEEVRRSYDHIEGSAFISNVLCRIKRDLPTQNFDPETFSYKVRWYPDCRLLAHIFVSERKQSVTINERTYHLEKGEELFPVNSYKPKVSDISKIAQNCKFETVRTFLCRKNRLALHVMKAI